VKVGVMEFGLKHMNSLFMVQVRQITTEKSN